MSRMVGTGSPGRSGAARLLLVAAAFAGGAAAGGFGAVLAFEAMGGTGSHARSASAAMENQHLDYVEIDNAFTTNLIDTGRFLQLRIAVSTTGGPATVAALGTHKLAVVSAVLGVLGDLGEADVSGGAAKARLRSKLRATINTVLRQKAGSTGIDEVFLTSLVIQ